MVECEAKMPEAARWKLQMATVHAHENFCSEDFIARTPDNAVSYEHPADV